MSHPIIVDGVSKQFRLQADRPNSVKEFFTRRDRDRAKTHFWALDDVSIEIPQGSMYALVGHNGSGKSTLLRCIAGIYRPDAGQVKVSGRISTLLELGAGFHPDLSGRENVYLNATILGMTRKEIDRAFDDIVSFAGVEQFIDSPVKVYSSGMYVRLGFSVAVHVQPEILIIDEVIAVGDEQFQRQCFEHLYKLRRDGVTIVVVTHGMATVQTMCDHAAWLDHGVLQEVGEAPAVALSYLRRVNQAEADRQDLEAARAVEKAKADADAGSGPADAGRPVIGRSREADKVPSRPRITTAGEHWGGGEVTITSVEFLDQSGKAVTVVGERSALRIRIGYEASGVYEQPTFGIAVHNESGLHVTGTNTRLAGRSTGTISGRGWVEYDVDRLPLLAGVYEISVAIEDQFSQHTFDRYDRGWTLRVRHDGEQAVVGLVDIGGDWTLGADHSG
ncbi:MAG TPA: ABC transporter ATP-binding protein [Microthrixaceae bacterium]|nr:ABC transporter ATP-binding protein [Microthrixaceae bacterium]HNI34391.1 ABC transporter ATP-binding protein [Microthrixaceae bacterium]